MAEYIDREQALRLLEEMRVSNDTGVLGKMYAKEILEKMKPADAVQCVRCKDCKRSEDVGDNDFVWCNLVEFIREKGWYCADGERKE